MASTYLFALKRKKDLLDERIHEEQLHPSCDHLAVRRMKEQKLHLKEQIERLQDHA